MIFSSSRPNYLLQTSLTLLGFFLFINCLLLMAGLTYFSIIIFTDTVLDLPLIKAHWQLLLSTPWLIGLSIATSLTIFYGAFIFWGWVRRIKNEDSTMTLNVKKLSSELEESQEKIQFMESAIGKYETRAKYAQNKMEKLSKTTTYFNHDANKILGAIRNAAETGEVTSETLTEIIINVDYLLAHMETLPSKSSMATTTMELNHKKAAGDKSYFPTNVLIELIAKRLKDRFGDRKEINAQISEFLTSVSKASRGQQYFDTELVFMRFDLSDRELIFGDEAFFKIVANELINNALELCDAYENRRLIIDYRFDEGKHYFGFSNASGALSFNPFERDIKGKNSSGSGFGCYRSYKVAKGLSGDLSVENIESEPVYLFINQTLKVCVVIKAIQQNKKNISIYLIEGNEEIMYWQCDVTSRTQKGVETLIITSKQSGVKDTLELEPRRATWMRRTKVIKDIAKLELLGSVSLCIYPDDMLIDVLFTDIPKSVIRTDKSFSLDQSGEAAAETILSDDIYSDIEAEQTGIRGFDIVRNDRKLPDCLMVYDLSRIKFNLMLPSKPLKVEI